MHTRKLLAGILLVSSFAALNQPTESVVASPVIAPARSADATLLSTYVLPDTPLGAFQNAYLPGSITNDRQINLGGIGSGLWRAPGDPADEFWMVTDRGPNVSISGSLAFAVPAFTPVILKVRATGANAIQVLSALPILTPSGAPATGLPNIATYDEKPVEIDGTTALAYTPSGLDSEGLIRLNSGEFFVVDEYAPSLLRVDATGKIVKRFVPQGLVYTPTLATLPTVSSLPGILTRRKGNRGFEGITLSADQKTLYFVVQSPLNNPNSATGNAATKIRLFAWDIATERTVGEFVYQFDPAASYEAGARPQDVKSSALAFVNPTTLLVQERTDKVAKVYSVDLTSGTNIMGALYDTTATSPTLEAFTNTLPAGVTPLSKTLVVDLSTIAGMPDKIEGIAIVNATTLAVANDNDFDLGTFVGGNNTVITSTKSKILTIQLDAPLPLNAAPPTADIQVTLLHTNDFHGHVEQYNTNGSATCSATACIGGSARLKTAIDGIRSSVSNTLLLDAGDQFQGTLYYNIFRADIVTATMNALGYQAMAVGNHELDNGPSELLKLANGATFPILSANMDTSGEPSFAGNKIKPSVILTTADGTQYGIVGVTTEETVFLASPGQLRFTPHVTATQNEINALIANGIDKIIVLSHMGYDVDLQLASKLTGADVILGGHTHTFLYTPALARANGDVPQGPYPTVRSGADGNTVIVATAGSWGRYLGRLDVGFSLTGTVKTWGGAPILMDSTIPENGAVKSVITPTFTSQVLALRGAAIGTSTVPMSVEVSSVQICRANECVLGNLVADALLWRVSQITTSIPADFAITNGGGLRAPIDAGSITQGEVLETLPFGNTIATFEITGTHVISSIETGLNNLGISGNGRFPQVAGLQYMFNPNNPVGKRLVSVSVRNPDGTYSPIIPTKLYRVATNNFMRTGGDGYVLFRDAAIRPYDFGPSLDEALTDYIKSRPNQTVSPAIEGRILALAKRNFLPLAAKQ